MENVYINRCKRIVKELNSIDDLDLMCITRKFEEIFGNTHIYHWLKTNFKTKKYNMDYLNMYIQVQTYIKCFNITDEHIVETFLNNSNLIYDINLNICNDDVFEVLLDEPEEHPTLLDELCKTYPLKITKKEDNKPNIIGMFGERIKELEAKCKNFEDKYNKNKKYIKDYNNFLSEAGLENIDDVKNIIKTNDYYKNENIILRKKIDEYENNKVNELEIKNISNLSTFPDYFTIHLFSETEEEKNEKIKNQKEKDYNLCLDIYKKNNLKHKLIKIFKELSLNSEKIKKEKEEKENKLRKKHILNQIKCKVRFSLTRLNEDSLTLYKLIEKVKKNKDIIFENKLIHQSAVNIDRSMMKFLSNLYEEKEINKTLSNKDFMLAVNEFHSDKNSTRMNHLCKIMYNLRKNDIIWNSNIIFKHIYSFQYIKDYQISYLINHIETILTT